MKNILITTTNSIENATIEKYLGVVTTNLVIGTNVFSDFVASFSDFFGGMSGTYRRQMDSLYEQAYEAISIKAMTRGANCIVGFKVDFDEISGKGKSMFMISVSGTAAKVKFSQNKAISEGSGLIKSIQNDSLKIEFFKHQWAKRNSEDFPTDKEWDFIIRYNLTELASSLYDYYYKACNDRLNYQDDPVFDNFPLLLSNMGYDDSVNVIYKDYPSRHAAAFDLIQDNLLFNPDKIFDLIQQGDVDNAINLLLTEKSEYTKEDIISMEKVIDSLESIPDKGSIQEVKSGLLSSKTTEMFICPNGHKNDKENDFCSTCGLNIKGLTQKQVNIIEDFKTRVNILKSLLK